MKKKLTHDELISLLKTEAKKAGSQKNYAEVLGISAQYFGDVIKGRREPGEKLLSALGLKRVVTFEPEEE